MTNQNRLRVYATAFITKDNLVQATIWTHLYGYTPRGSERCLAAFHAGGYVMASVKDASIVPMRVELMNIARTVNAQIDAILKTARAMGGELADPIPVIGEPARVDRLYEILYEALDHTRETGESAEVELAARETV